MKVTHDPEARTFTMTGRVWFDTYPIEDLPKWLDFYQRMKVDHPKAKGAYDSDVAALEALAVELGIALS